MCSVMNLQAIVLIVVLSSLYFRLGFVVYTIFSLDYSMSHIIVAVLLIETTPVEKAQLK